MKATVSSEVVARLIWGVDEDYHPMIDCWHLTCSVRKKKRNSCQSNCEMVQLQQ